MKFNKRLKTIFLDPACERFEIDDEVNVILSPSMYWVKKVSLPVKSIREAKQLLPSLFEETLPKEGVFSYSVYKKGEHFFIFAYEDKLILDTLNQKGIQTSKVKGVYFAQSELDSISGAVKINNKQSLYVQDDIVVLVPCCWIEESGDLYTDDIELSKHMVKLKHFSHIVDNKTLYSLMGVTSVLIVLWAVEYISVSNKLSALRDANGDVFIKEGLKPTMMQNISIAKKYKDIHHRQIITRDTVSEVLKTKLPSGVKVEHLVLDEKKLLVRYSGLKKDQEKIVKNLFDKNKIAYGSYFKNGSWYLEFEL